MYVLRTWKITRIARAIEYVDPVALAVHIDQSFVFVRICMIAAAFAYRCSARRCGYCNNWLLTVGRRGYLLT